MVDSETAKRLWQAANKIWADAAVAVRLGNTDAIEYTAEELKVVVKDDGGRDEMG